MKSEFVGRLAALEPSAVKATRDLFRAAENMPLDNALDTGRQLNELIERTGDSRAPAESSKAARVPNHA